MSSPHTPYPDDHQLLFDIDEFDPHAFHFPSDPYFTRPPPSSSLSAPAIPQSMPPPQGLGLDLVKDEPDLTIPLGWASAHHFASAATSALPTVDASDPSAAQSFPFDWYSHDASYFDAQSQAQALFTNNTDSSIPWSAWTDLVNVQSHQPQDEFDSEMPPTPLTLPLNDQHLFQIAPSSPELGLTHPGIGMHDSINPMSIAPNLDLLSSPFTSMALESPPMVTRTCPPAHTQPQSYPIQSGPIPPVYDLGQYQSSTDALKINAPRNPPSPFVKSGASQGIMPTLSSSLPSSLVSPPNVLRASRSPPRQSRLRAKSDASDRAPSPHAQHKPTGRRRRHGSENPDSASPNPLKPPKQSLSTWQIFFTDWIARQDAQGGRKLNVAQAAKEAGKEYKLLSDAEKEPYAIRARQARSSRQQALSNWHSSLTPSLIALENKYRTTQRKLGLSRRSNLRDPNAPKKPLSAYFMFLKAVREDENWSRIVFEGERETTRQSVLAAAKWREMPDEEKRPFLARAEQEKLEYEAARQAYEDSFNNAHDDSSASSSRDPSRSPRSSNVHRPRANSTGSSAMAFRLDDLGSLDSPIATSAPSQSGMGYFSLNSSGAIPIHIPKTRMRTESTPEPNSRR